VFDLSARSGSSNLFQKEFALHPNKQLVKKFYEAFHARDAAGMNACYDPAIEFDDPAFGFLEGEKVFAMWQMLCARARELDVVARDIQADDGTGFARWEAKYLFGPNRRPVHNTVDARFVFRNGKIVKHADSFSMWKWSGMAVGTMGVLLGWTPFMKAAIQKSIRRQLEEFMQNKPA